MASCSEDRGVRTHRWMAPKPGDRCWCGRFVAPDEEFMAVLVEQVELTDEGFARLSHEATLRDLQWLFRDIEYG